jgi:uncharacterized membrane protein YcaP (DUF421 family)
MDIVLRATFMFAAIFLLLRLLGKRELAEMTPFEVVLLVVMGDLVQQGVTHNDFSLTGAVLAISTFAFWALVLNWASYYWPTAERFIDGEPEVVACDGKLNAAKMRRNRLTRGEFESEMRHAGIARLDDVAWAILEDDGKISFIGKMPADKADRSENDRGDAPH